MEAINIDELLSRKYSLFHPRSKMDLMMDYPELRNIPALKLDNPKKLLFVWAYACRCSRARELTDKRDRIRYAMHFAWGKNPPKDIRETYPEERWGQRVQEAIEAMNAFEPAPRMLMKVMAGAQMERVKKMMEERKDEPKTWDEKLDYVKFVKSGFDLLRDLQPLTEVSALGVVLKEAGMEQEEGYAMAEVDKYLGEG